MIVVLGESASGKTTLVNDFVRENPDYHKLVTYTTRPMRAGEQDGIDYHFIDQSKFSRLIEKDFFIEHTTYRGWSYGVAKEDCYEENAIAILTPAGLRALKRGDTDVTSIYLMVDRRSRLINILARGDDIEEAYRRNLTEVGQFDEVEAEVDYVIDNAGFHMDREQAYACLRTIINHHFSERKV